MANLFEIVGEIAIQGVQNAQSAISETNRKASNLADKMGAAGDATQRFGDRVSETGDKATAAAAGIAGVATAAGAAINSVSQTAQQIGVMSERLGVSAEFLQTWQRVAKDLNIEAEALRDGFKEVSLRADEFAETGKGPAADAFKRLGLSQDEIERVKGDTEALFNLVLENIQNVQGQAARQRTADELFGGQAGEQFTNLLNKSQSQIDELVQSAQATGGFFSAEDIENARSFNRRLNETQERLGAVGQKLVAKLLPALEKLLPIVESQLVPALSTAVGAITTLVQAFSSLPTPVQTAVVQMAAFAVTLGPILSIGGRLISVFGSFLKVFGKIPGVNKLIAAGFTSIKAILAPLFTIIGSGVALLASFWGGWKLGKEVIAPLIKEFLPGVWKWIGKVVAAFVNWKDTLATVWAFIKEQTKALWQFFKQIFQRLKTFFVEITTAVFDKAKQWAIQFKEFVVGKITALWNGIKSILDSLKQGFLDAFEFIKAQTIGRVKSMVDTVVGIVEEMWNALTGNSIIPRMANEAVAEFTKMADEAERQGERTKRGLEKSISAAAPRSGTGGGPGAGVLGEGGGGGAQEVNIDMSRATFNDGRDMLNRLKRKGSDLTGAFD